MSGMVMSDEVYEHLSKIMTMPPLLTGMVIRIPLNGPVKIEYEAFCQRAQAEKEQA